MEPGVGGSVPVRCRVHRQHLREQLVALIDQVVTEHDREGRVADVVTGAQHGVPVIFVRWGFSWPHESEGASAVADDLGELRVLLLPGA